MNRTTALLVFLLVSGSVRGDGAIVTLKELEETQARTLAGLLCIEQLTTCMNVSAKSCAGAVYRGVYLCNTENLAASGLTRESRERLAFDAIVNAKSPLHACVSDKMAALSGNGYTFPPECRKHLF